VTWSAKHKSNVLLLFDLAKIPFGGYGIKIIGHET